MPYVLMVPPCSPPDTNAGAHRVRLLEPRTRRDTPGSQLS